MRLKVEVSAPSAEIQQDVSERTKKTEWLQKCWCQEGRKDREKRECDEMMNCWLLELLVWYAVKAHRPLTEVLRIASI